MEAMKSPFSADLAATAGLWTGADMLWLREAVAVWPMRACAGLAAEAMFTRFSIAHSVMTLLPTKAGGGGDAPGSDKLAWINPGPVRLATWGQAMLRRWGTLGAV